MRLPTMVVMDAPRKERLEQASRKLSRFESEESSRARQRRSSISKQGNSMMRHLVGQAAEEGTCMGTASFR
jgi:hypothetical protein